MFFLFILSVIIVGNIECGKKYLAPDGSLDHLNAQRLLDLNHIDKEAFKCIPCNKILKRYYDFSRHRHKDECIYRPQVASHITNSLMIQCGFCGFQEETSEKMKMHQSNIHTMQKRIEKLSADELKKLESDAIVAFDKLEQLRDKKD